MKIDSILKEFSEKYDREAIQSIQDISTDYALTSQKHTIKAFTINEGFNQFLEFMTGYSSYMVENAKRDPTHTEPHMEANGQDCSQSAIVERTETFIKTKLFQESRVLYSDLPTFVESYISEIGRTIETVDKLKNDMLEAGVDHECIAAMNTFTDTFVTCLNESFDPVMNTILMASGYYTRKGLAKPSDGARTEKPVFL